MSAWRKETDVRLAVAHLKDARDLLAAQGCAKAADKTRTALRSAEGALRNAHRFAAKARRNGFPCGRETYRKWAKGEL